MNEEIGCIAPGTIPPEDLVAWVDGIAPASVAAHIAACASCRQRALEYRHLSTLLAGVLHRVDCPDLAVLTDYAYDLLPPEQRTATATHLIDCGTCRSELAELREDLTGLAVPAHSISLLERLTMTMATLVAAPTPSVATVRAGQSGPTMTYIADNVQIVLDVISVGDSGEGIVTVRGLVLSDEHSPEALARSRVDLFQDQDNGPIVMTAGVDRFGHFTFNAVPAGIYTLQLSFPDRAVVIQEFSCQSRTS